MVPLIYSVRSVIARKTTTLLTAGGVAGVVFVLSAALMLQSGIHETLGKAGSSTNAIVLRKGSASEMASVLASDTVSVVQAAPGVAREADASPHALSELVLINYADSTSGKGGGNVQIRGVPANVLAFRRDLRIVAGRAARPGSNEAIVGKALRGNFKNLDLGQSFELRRNRSVEVVGVFELGGSAFESEVWIDLDFARAAFGREGVVSTVRVELESPDSFDVFRSAVEADRRFAVEVLREDAFFEKQSEGTAMFVGAMGIFIALFASIGAMVGAASTMYAAVNQRRRETGVLRALGFSGTSVLLCFVLESFLVTLAGGVLGALLSLGMVFIKFSVLSVASFSQVVFKFHPTPGTIIASLLIGGLMGIVGGVLPAVRAARLSPIEAMRC
jgi:putative ABC transport system permease protein